MNSKNKISNITIAGYHVLMILSAVDHHFHEAEDAVIRDFLLHQFPENVDFDTQLEIISTLKPTEWAKHFDEVMQYFFDNASQKQRSIMVNFSIDLVKADKRVSPEEHKFIKKFLKKYELLKNVGDN